MAGWYELKKASNGKYHFSLKSANGEIVLTSEMYEAKSSAEAGIASVQKNCAEDVRYAPAEASNGKFYFTLKAGNNQVIGTSQMYSSSASRDNGIASVKTNGMSKVIKEATK